MSGTGEPTDILSVADVVRDRWKVVSFDPKTQATPGPRSPLGLRQPNSSLISGEEDRGRGVRGDLRGGGPAESGYRGPEGGVGSAAQAGAEDGGGRVEEAPG